MRDVGEAAEQDFQGLPSAASRMRRYHVIAARLAKQLVRIDDALAVVRRIDTIKALALRRALFEQLAGADHDDDNVGRGGIMTDSEAGFPVMSGVGFGHLR